MKVLSASLALLFCVARSNSDHYNLRPLKRTANQVNRYSQEQRQIQSVGGKEVSWSNNEASEPGEAVSADPEDFLRSGDKCFKDGSISASNCPSKPECNSDEKACINRLPTSETGEWYVAAMRCIPKWENCDKCMCGIISSDTGKDATCSFSGQKPDDDGVIVDCSSLSSVTINGVTLNIDGSSSTNSVSNKMDGKAKSGKNDSKSPDNSTGTDDEADEALETQTKDDRKDVKDSSEEEATSSSSEAATATLSTAAVAGVGVGVAGVLGGLAFASMKLVQRRKRQTQ